jgi:hypothetical protein
MSWCKLLMPSPEALDAYADRLGSRRQGVFFIHHQSYRIAFEIILKPI